MSAVYKAIAAVQGELAKVGIAKSRKNMTPGQNYNFRGIDEVYGALSPLLASHGLCVLPRILSREVTTRATKNGGTLFCVTVEAEFDFVAAEDGSCHTIRTFGEAMDSSDKATNKAMSAAYKYAALMAFAIPTEGDNDADAHTHEVAAKPAVEEPKRTNWGGKYPNKSKLHAALTGFEREIRSIGDDDTLDAFILSEDWKAFYATANDHMPHYLFGGDPAPEEFKGLQTLIDEMRDEFRSARLNDFIPERNILAAG